MRAVRAEAKTEAKEARAQTEERASEPEPQLADDLGNTDWSSPGWEEQSANAR